MSKIIALFGGSFNPAHEGHFTMASYVQNTLAVDETWMLFSQNPDKDPMSYPSLEHRMNMARLMAKHYHPKIVLSDKEATIAAAIGRHETYYILQELQQQHPDTQFVFVMGADSFLHFHLWQERDDIMRDYPILVVGRPGYNEGVMTCPTAQSYHDSMIDLTDPEILRNASHGWCFIHTPYATYSSKTLADQIANGQTDFDGHFAEVANYILTHNLYNPANRGSL